MSTRSLHFAPLPTACLVDEALHIRVQGVRAGQRVHLRLANAGAPGRMWLSDAVFVAAGDEVDLARDAPLSGSSRGTSSSRRRESTSADSVAGVDPRLRGDDGEGSGHSREGARRRESTIADSVAGVDPCQRGDDGKGSRGDDREGSRHSREGGNPRAPTPRPAWITARARLRGNDDFLATPVGGAPTPGCYEGVDPMGLFWSRTEHARVDDEVIDDPMTLTLTARIEGEDGIARHRLKRSFQSASVRRTDIAEDGLVARLFEPEGAGPHAAVLVVGGSGGGFQWSHEMAALLASRGFAAMALAYFGLPGLPASLNRIPLDSFGRALEWLQALPAVGPRRIGVMGVSRGGELALLLASTYPAIRAVVAYVPSGVMWSGYPSTGQGAWTWQGRELPVVDTMPSLMFTRLLARKGIREDTPAAFELLLGDAAAVEAATIRVEKINGPVMMVTGQADGLWPCERLSAIALDRLRAHRFAHRVEHLSYAGAGHGIGWPNVITTVTQFSHPVSGAPIDLGGAPAATARASRDSWPQVLAFLAESLAG